MIDVRATVDISKYGRPLHRADYSEAGSDVPANYSSSVARLAVSGLSIIAVMAWVIGEATGTTELRVSGGLWYCLVGIGAAPWSLSRGLATVTRIVLTGLTALAVLTIGSTAMLVIGAWWPRQTLLILILFTLPAHLYCCRITFPEVAAAGRVPVLDPGSPREALAIGLALTGSSLCLGSALTHRHIDPGFWGFLPEIGVFWFLGLGQLLMSVVISTRARQAVMAVCVVALTLATVGTPALVYDGPRSQSAAKHVDLIEQIRTFHELASSIKVYNAWPGFFGAIAWICDGCGIQDPMVLATAWPVVIGGLRIAALRFLAGAVIGNARLAWTATALALLADPIGADYFSPQSIGFVLGLMAFGFAIGSGRLGVPRWCESLAIGISGCALAVSHQLSPYLVSGVLILLVVFRQVRPWWLPLLVVTPTLGWVVTHLDSVQGFVAISDIGRFYNFRPPPRPMADGLSRLPVVAQASGALVLGIVTTGILALVALMRERHDLRMWAVAACPSVGLAFVLINPYGNEGIFRASLFGIPWLATLAARAFDGLSTQATEISFGMIGCLLTITFLVAAFGLDGTNVMRQSDRNMFDYLRERTTRTDSRTVLLDLGIGDLPMSPPGPWGRYLTIQRSELGEPIHKTGGQPAEVLVARLTSRLVSYTGEEAGKTTLYALWSPVSMRYGWAYGVVHPRRFGELREAFQHCGYWTVARKEGGTILFRFDAGRYARAER